MHYVDRVSVWQTILIYVGPVIAAYVLITLLVARRKVSGKPRYRVGQPWPYEPLFWTANPEGAHLSADDDHADDHAAAGIRVGGERGGARGSW